MQAQNRFTPPVQALIEQGCDLGASPMYAGLSPDAQSRARHLVAAHQLNEAKAALRLPEKVNDASLPPVVKARMIVDAVLDVRSESKNGFETVHTAASLALIQDPLLEGFRDDDIITLLREAASGDFHAAPYRVGAPEKYTEAQTTLREYIAKVEAEKEPTLPPQAKK